jgi:hypothetical protein
MRELGGSYRVSGFAAIHRYRGSDPRGASPSGNSSIEEFQL